MWNFGGRSEKNNVSKKKSKNTTPKFPCPKSWKIRLFGTWKSIFEDFDDLCTSMNFKGLRDVESKYSAIKMWNFIGRSKKINVSRKKNQKKLTLKFSFPKSWKTRLFGTWKSIYDDFDDLCTSMKF